jgi:hypothetical protein
MEKLIMKESEVKEVLEMLVGEYLEDNSDYVNEDGVMDWDGDGSNIGIKKEELINDFINYIKGNWNIRDLEKQRQMILNKK